MTIEWLKHSSGWPKIEVCMMNGREKQKYLMIRVQKKIS